MDVVMSDGEPQSTSTQKTSSIGSSFGMNPVTECTYGSTFWPQISCFVRSAMQTDMQIERPLHTFSHEELYRSIYWMCWQGFQKRLYADLTSVIEESLNTLEKQLENIQQMELWLEKFKQICVNHARATDILGSVFAYLDKTYIQYALHENLRDILVERFQHLILEKSEMRAIFVFSMILDSPEAFSLDLVVGTVEALYKINPDNIYLNPTLFQNSIKNMTIPCNLDDIRHRHVTLEAKYQLERLKNEGWEPGFSQLKRPSAVIEEDDTQVKSSKRQHHSS
ncbi:2840_t:CDS:2 [Acaulospora morrowiae]|uniref:2840_t:CDS:1 n=1 Tax=Acaulospora morrowiae TaxID=94023 RepID=A0A9N9D676_9GLOM|nr:2840_t:CDS:2 [Acaulospora morrowiae]